MDISKGYEIEQPRVFVPWGIDEAGLAALLRDVRPRRVTDGYWTVECVSLGGLKHMLGFHFEPRDGGVLAELEMFRNEPNDVVKSYAEVQRHIEATFGPPEAKKPDSGAYPAYRWIFGHVALWHYVDERSGPGEVVRVRWDGTPAAT